MKAYGAAERARAAPAERRASAAPCWPRLDRHRQSSIHAAQGARLHMKIKKWHWRCGYQGYSSWYLTPYFRAGKFFAFVGWMGLEAGFWTELDR